ncbi:MAG TPA: S8 family serine peptidase, partial [Gaiellaceae bacterium]|nr:S8 family serine peptidase [Gaiellaceae bacterium]
RTSLRTMGALLRPASLLICGVVAGLVLATGGASARVAGGDGPLVEVVVTLPQAPLARAVADDRSLESVRTRAGVDIRKPAAASYLRSLAAAQRTLAARVETTIPGASIRWHYATALDGISVVLPRSQLSRLAALPGATVWPTVTYHDLSPQVAKAAADDVTPGLIGASQLWGPDLATAGQGIKIAIVDDGIDQTHVFFDPTGYAYPPGFPKGNTAYTTPKVIVARAFPSPSTSWKYAATPFDPTYSDHATHVAGIAAGDYDTLANSSRGKVRVSGIAPKAYLGNYKVLTVPTDDYGLDGNGPEIAKGIDQAVADGMNVINLSLGEPEIEPSRDVVVTALENAAAAGVVSTIAANNEYTDWGRGSISSPGNAPDAITVAASTESGPPDEIAYFSSAGPTPLSLLLKPDVTAPGVSVLSSVPGDNWAAWDGTSMAAPHAAGAAALLLQRHPTWTPAEVKSALETTGDPVHGEGSTAELGPAREGGGRIDLVRADQPLIFATPQNLSWGLVKDGFSGTKTVAITDAGGGAAPWTMSVVTQSSPAGVSVAPTAATVSAGENLGVALTVAKNAPEGDASGWIVLTRGADVRRIPFWLHVEIPKLGLDPHTTLTKPGLYHGDTKGKASRVSTYRWPDKGLASGVPTALGGPEQVYRFTLRKRVANFGVVVVSRGSGVTVSPRIVKAGDENRLAGNTAIPATQNPYVGIPVPDPVVGAVLPIAGAYDIVFDTPTGAKPGTFTFRFWVNDTTPPAIRLLTPAVAAGTPIRFSVTDAGSGVDPGSIRVLRDGSRTAFSYKAGTVSIDTATLKAGAHQFTLDASDYQETRNMEDVGPVLPNTRALTVTVNVS